MLDIQFIRENKQLVEEKSLQKGYKINLDKIIDLDSNIRKNIPILEEIQKQRKQLSSQFSNTTPNQEEIDRGKELKNKASEIEKVISGLKAELKDSLRNVPNMPLGVVPVGSSEDENKVVKKVGTPKEYDFEPKNHWELNPSEKYIDKVRATKVAGTRFVYLKGNLVRLQFAIVNCVMYKL